MKKACFKQKKPSFLLLFSLLLISSVILAPAAVKAEDADSIKALRQMGKAFAGIADKASAAVVTIKAEKVETQSFNSIPDWPFGDPFGNDPFEDDFFKRFFRRDSNRRLPQQREITRPVQGSGFIISADGYILTNNHLVGGAKKVYVKVGEEADIKAEVIGTDPPTDLAVIKIKKENLPFLELGDSDKLEVGEWVLAIGNPFGLSHTVTAGIVSAKGRSGFSFSGESPAYQDFIQTDAAINPGNSGGPLIDLDGKAVGINAAIVGAGVNIGIGFAIPINMAKGIYEQLISGGKVVRGFLGVSIQDLTPEMADSLGIKDAKGAIIPEVQEDSPADKAGIKPGDVIVELDGKAVENANDLSTRIAAMKPGTTVKLTVIREGKRQTITAELEERKFGEEQGAEKEQQPSVQEKLGISVQNLDATIAERLGYKDQQGVIITQVEQGSAADREGLSTGMLIIEANQKKIKNTDDFKEALKDVKEGDNVLLLVKNQYGSRYLVLRLEE
jgi:serine protease Do